MYTTTAPLLEVAPYTTFCILLLMVASTIYLRSQILRYTEKKLPHCFTKFRLYEEQQDETTSLALYNYISSNAFAQTNDPVFIDMCKRYIRWGQLFILFFVIAIVDIGLIEYLFR